METLKTLLGTMRIPFLLLTPACVSVGVGTAYWQMGGVDWLTASLILLGAVSAHISVNVFNEYYDFKSGLDVKTERTPFSGGSGALPGNPHIARVALVLAWATLLITAVVGVYFISELGMGLLPIGLFGLFLVLSYTTWCAYNPLLCLLAPGLGFGVLMVMGTDFVLTGSYSLLSFTASLIPTFLVSNLLLLNQFPDVEADKSVGRRHFPITIGVEASSVLLGVMYLLAYLAIVLGVLLSLLPRYALIALLTAGFAWRSYRRARRYATDIPALLPAMKINVLVNLLTPALLAVSFFVA